MLYTLAFWMGFFELLRRAFEVSTHVLELRRHLLLERELLQVDRVVRVGSDGRVGVLLPRERLGSADDDLKTVVVDGAGEGARQSAFGDEGLHGLFHLRTEGLERRLGFVTCYLRSEKLVDYIIISCHNSSALFMLVPCEWVKSVKQITRRRVVIRIRLQKYCFFYKTWGQ